MSAEHAAAATGEAGSSSRVLRRWCHTPLGGVAPRVLAVVAHPDDEVLGLGGRMGSVARDLYVAYVSDGAPVDERFYRPLGFDRREQYAAMRRKEAQRGLALAGVAEGRAYELGVIDQQVAAALERVVDWLMELIPNIAPDGVLTHAYEGGHPDHDATACAVHVALERLAHGGGPRWPLWEFAGYHARGGELIRGRFFQESGAHTSSHEECVVLDDVARALKLRLLECHATQREFWSTFPLEAEYFRLAPKYDFSRAPAAPFFYDRVDWGVSGATVLEAAGHLLAAHHISEPC